MSKEFFRPKKWPREGCNFGGYNVRVVITGVAGFIGSFVAEALLKRGDEILGIDNLNNYYDIKLKEARLNRIKKSPGFEFRKIDIIDRLGIETLFKEWKPDRVVHLAAQAGVRYSSKNPYVYVDSNITGFLNILEGCRHHGTKHLVYASTSSVYGSNSKIPFSVNDEVDRPLSLYAATKKSNELMAHCYSHLYQFPATGLRFFTVYGPWGRPDMALFLFTKAILSGEPIQVFNHGQHRRDFTYIGDIVEGLVRVLDKPPRLQQKLPETKNPFYRIYNIGSHRSIHLMEFIDILEDLLGKKAQKEFLPLQPGDVPETFADVEELVQDFAFQPKTNIREGMIQFVEWYRSYYKV